MPTNRRVCCFATRNVVAKENCELFLFPLVPLSYNAHHLWLEFQSVKSSNLKQPPEVFYIKGVVKNFAKFTGKHLGQSLLFNKVAGLRSATLLKKRLWHRCFSVNFVKFLRTPFLQNTLGRLLLNNLHTD